MFGETVCPRAWQLLAMFLNQNSRQSFSLGIPGSHLAWELGDVLRICGIYLGFPAVRTEDHSHFDIIKRVRAKA